MKLIVTGHDYAGKSHFLEFLRESIPGISYIHMTEKDDNSYQMYSRLSGLNNYIMDRCFLDELVYPCIYNRESRLTVDDISVLLAKYAASDATIVIFRCNDKELEKRKLYKDDKKEVVDNLKEIRFMYDYIAKIFNIPVIDTSGKTNGDIYNELVKIIEGEAHEEYKSN